MTKALLACTVLISAGCSIGSVAQDRVEQQTSADEAENCVVSAPVAGLAFDVWVETCAEPTAPDA
ncbi:MAG: hypothetical protein AAF376_06220 [Pseudomonadota bacterium]